MLGKRINTEFVDLCSADNMEFNERNDLDGVIVVYDFGFEFFYKKPTMVTIYFPNFWQTLPFSLFLGPLFHNRIARYLTSQPKKFWVLQMRQLIPFPKIYGLLGLSWTPWALA